MHDQHPAGPIPLLEKKLRKKPIVLPLLLALTGGGGVYQTQGRGSVWSLPGVNLGHQFADVWGHEELDGDATTRGGGLELDDMHGDTVPCDQQPANLCPFPSTRSF